MNEWDRFMTEWDKLMETLHLPEHKFTVEEVEEIIKDYDFVPVVRCKDCKYWYGSGNYCDYEMRAFEDDFCSRGERKKRNETD